MPKEKSIIKRNLLYSFLPLFFFPSLPLSFLFIFYTTDKILSGSDPFRDFSWENFLSFASTTLKEDKDLFSIQNVATIFFAAATCVIALWAVTYLKDNYRNHFKFMDTTKQNTRKHISKLFDQNQNLIELDIETKKRIIEFCNQNIPDPILVLITKTVCVVSALLLTFPAFYNAAHQKWFSALFMLLLSYICIFILHTVSDTQIQKQKLDTHLRNLKFATLQYDIDLINNLKYEVFPAKLFTVCFVILECLVIESILSGRATTFYLTISMTLVSFYLGVVVLLIGNNFSSADSRILSLSESMWEEPGKSKKNVAKYVYKHRRPLSYLSLSLGELVTATIGVAAVYLYYFLNSENLPNETLIFPALFSFAFTILIIKIMKHIAFFRETKKLLENVEGAIVELKEYAQHAEHKL